MASTARHAGTVHLRSYSGIWVSRTRDHVVIRWEQRLVNICSIYQSDFPSYGRDDQAHRPSAPHGETSTGMPNLSFRSASNFQKRTRISTTPSPTLSSDRSMPELSIHCTKRQRPVGTFKNIYQPIRIRKRTLVMWTAVASQSRTEVGFPSTIAATRTKSWNVMVARNPSRSWASMTTRPTAASFAPKETRLTHAQGVTMWQGYWPFYCDTSTRHTRDQT